jgi:hypothetical protein
MRAAWVLYRAIAFSAGALSALALAAVLGIVGPKHRPSSAGEKEPERRLALPETEGPRISKPRTSSAAPALAPSEPRVVPFVVQSRREPAKPQPASSDRGELEVALLRTLKRAGLSMEDLDLFPAASTAKVRYEAARRSRDAHEIDVAASALIREVQAVRIGRELVKRKLDAVAAALQDPKSAIPAERFRGLETRYLDLAAELESTEGERAMHGLLVRISALEQDVRVAGWR